MTFRGHQGSKLPVEKSVKSVYCWNGTNIGTIRIVFMSRLRLLKQD